MVKELFNLEELKENTKEGICVVDCFATWCGPCKMLAPVIEELSEETSYKYFKIDVDKANDVASFYNISSIPNIFIFKDGKLELSLLGFRPKETLLTFIESIK